MPFVNNAKIYWSQAVIDAILDGMIIVAADPFLDAPKVQLYQAPHTPAPQTDTPASFEEAVFDGYSAQALTLGATKVDSANGGRQRYGQVNFVQTGISTGTPSIYGALLVDTTEAILYGQVVFDTPIPMNEAGAFISLGMAAILDFLQGA